MLTIFSMFLQSMQNAFEKSTISKVAYSIVYMVLVIIALNSFHVAINYTNEAIGTMISFVLALIPLLLALIAASGGLISAAFFHPVILFLMNISGLFMQYVILPLLFLSALLSIVSTMSVQYKVTQLAQLAEKLEYWVDGTFLNCFSWCYLCSRSIRRRHRWSNHTEQQNSLRETLFLSSEEYLRMQLIQLSVPLSC